MRQAHLRRPARQHLPFTKFLAGVVLLAAVVLLVLAGGGIGRSSEMETSSIPLRTSNVRPPPTRPTPSDQADDVPPKKDNIDTITKDASSVVPSTSNSMQKPQSSAGYANGAANRSPKRPVIGISGAVVDSPKVKTTVQSWGINGQPTTTPKWAIPLADTARRMGVYAKLVEAVSDPWMVMILWVPSRFMGPQKVGRKANGAIMIPPTKGRDNAVYLQEYNATWHSSFTVEGLEYHAQVVHRNAIAVCIRERLYLNAMYLHAIPEEKPLFMYHCPCRHCKEPVLDSPKASRKLEEEFPTYHNPIMHAGDMKLTTVVAPISPEALKPVVDGRSREVRELRDSRGTCLGGDAAPWLVPHTTAGDGGGDPVAFPYEGLHGSLQRLLGVQADPLSGAIMVVIFNKFWIDHLHNYIFSMVHRAQFKHYIVATMDSEALALCIANRLPCFDATPFAELEEDTIVTGVGSSSNSSLGSKGFVRKVTEAMSWIKPRLALAVLQMGYHFFMSDLDLSFNIHPISYLLQPHLDIAHQCDAKGKLSINSGFYFARSNHRVIRFFHNIMTFTPEENSDQTAMKLFAKYDTTHQISHNCLDRKLFNMKCYYKVDGSIKVIDGKETFQWYDFNRDRSTFNWAILHATCLAGALPKLVYLRTMNAWFLDDLDAYTGAPPISNTTATTTTMDDAAGVVSNKKDTYCIKLPTTPPMEFQQSASVQTAHSPKYHSQVTDDVFLKARH